MRITPEENEARILHFKRETVADGVHVARVALRRGESSTFHQHTTTRDHFFVMEGRLTITLRLGTRGADECYRILGSATTEVSRDHLGEAVHRVRLLPGDMFRIEPGIAHCAANMDEEHCRFLCIEGIGAYDFVEV